MFKILPTNRFSKAKSYNFHFHKSEHRDVLLQMAYVFRAKTREWNVLPFQNSTYSPDVYSGTPGKRVSHY